MKILFCITRADTVGGAQVHVRDMARRLSQQGHTVLVLTGMAGPYNAALKHCWVNSIACDDFQQKISLLQDCKSLNFLVKTIRSFQPNIVSTHSSKAGVIGRIACQLTHTPCIFTAHGWAFTEGVPEPTRTLYRLIERSVEPLADKIICVSDHDQQIGLATGMSPTRLLTIHNGMPDIPSTQQATPEQTKPVKITMIARFDKQKNHRSLFEAVSKIPGVQLNLVGDGPNLEATKAYAEQLGITDQVNFLGFRSDVASVLAQSHIFALISHWEGFPRTIIEAMRAGLPIVASDVGGVAEAVSDGITGYCIPRGNVTLLRDRLTQLVKDPELRKTMGQAARQRYEAEFTFEHMFQQTLDVYQDVLAKHGK